MGIVKHRCHFRTEFTRCKLGATAVYLAVRLFRNPGLTATLMISVVALVWLYLISRLGEILDSRLYEYPV